MRLRELVEAVGAHGLDVAGDSGQAADAAVAMGRDAATGPAKGGVIADEHCSRPEDGCIGADCVPDLDAVAAQARCVRRWVLGCCRGGRPDYDDSGDDGRGGGDYAAVVVAYTLDDDDDTVVKLL